MIMADYYRILFHKNNTIFRIYFENNFLSRERDKDKTPHNFIISGERLKHACKLCFNVCLKTVEVIDYTNMGTCMVTFAWRWTHSFNNSNSIVASAHLLVCQTNYTISLYCMYLVLVIHKPLHAHEIAKTK